MAIDQFDLYLAFIAEVGDYESFYKKKDKLVFDVST